MTDVEGKILRLLHAYRKKNFHGSMDEKEIAEAIGVGTTDTRIYLERMSAQGWVQLLRFGVMEVRVLVTLTTEGICTLAPQTV